MELCLSRTISKLPHHGLFVSDHTHLLRWKASLSLKQHSVSRTNSGLLYCANPSTRSTKSEETSSGASQYVREEPGVITAEDVQPIEKNSYAEIEPQEVPTEGFAIDGRNSEFVDKLDLDSVDGYSVLLFGGGALVSLWIAAVVVASIDSIPVFPKLMEVMGLGYTVWFSTRYLIFKKNREELVASFEEIKQQILGSNDD